MQHASDRELLLFVDGELDPVREVEIRGHLLTCEECAEKEEAIRQVSRGYEGLLNEMPLPTAGPARARLMEGLEPSHNPWLVPVAGALGLAASILLVLLNPWHSDLSAPKNSLTPGETRTIALGEVCRGESGARMIPASVQEKVFREYGLTHAEPGQYEVDYLITPELGGADSIRNLWPQPYSTRWNAHVKDALEERLRNMVCEGKLDLATAQKDIATDWIGAYKKYFHTDKPLQNPI